MSAKLKGIYDALDHANYKSALKLCSGFLQKLPGHALCRALHAVALERSGRRDEALQFCHETVAAGATAEVGSAASLDDTCLSTLQVVFRRCRDQSAITQMYEAALAREPDSEEFAACLFFAALREGDFTKAQQVATKVYRMLNKPHLLRWVITSILLQVRAGGPGKALDLAAMMLQKAPINMEALKLDEPAPFNRGELYLLLLHLSTLQMQHKQVKALELLEACKGLVKLPSDLTALRVQLFSEGGQLAEAVQEARRQVLSSPGSCGAVQDYARLVFELPLLADLDASCRLSRPSNSSPFPSVSSLEEVEQHRTKDEVWNALLLFRHFQQVKETGISSGGGSGVNRVAFIGELELRRAGLAASELKGNATSAADVADLVGTMEAFVLRFGSRCHCFFDLKPFLCLLQADAVQVLEAAAVKGKGPEAIVLAARLRRALKMRPREPSDGYDSLLKQEAHEASTLVEAWLGLRGDGGTPPPEALLQLSVVALLEMDRISCLQNKAANRPYILDAIGLAQMGLAAYPHAFAFKVQLMLLYSALGLPGLMMNVYGTLDIKNIQHESLSYLVLDTLSGCCGLEGLSQVCKNIEGFHEDLDKDGSEALSTAFNMGALQRVPEYIDSLTQVSRSLMWGRAVVEEALLDVGAATSWESMGECLRRQSMTVSAICDKPAGYWVLRNQDRGILNGMHPLPLLTAAGSLCPPESELPHSEVPRLRLRAQPRSVGSVAMTWGGPCSAGRAPPSLRRGEQGAAEELLHQGLEGSPSSQLRLSASILGVLALLHHDGPSEDSIEQFLQKGREALQGIPGTTAEPSLVVSSARGLLSEDLAGAVSASWSSAPAHFRALCWSSALMACETASLVLRCCSGREAWEQVTQRLDGLSSIAKGFIECIREEGAAAAFAPPPRGSPADSEVPASGPRSLCIGHFGIPWLWSFLTGCTTALLPVALWCCTSLPKAGSGKKVKDGHEALHSSRVALKNLLQVLQGGLADLQSDLAGAAADPQPLRASQASDAPEVYDFAQVPAMAFSALADFPRHRETAQEAVLDAHRKQLKSLHEAIAQRLALLKSRGAFKP